MSRDQSPFFLALHSFEVDPHTGDLGLSLMATDGLRYGLTLSAGVVPALAATIAGVGKQIEASAPLATGQWENLQALTVQAIRAIGHGSGLVGLELKTAEGLPLSILFDRSLLPALRESLDDIERS
jgi:hypothetical protein